MDTKKPKPAMTVAEAGKRGGDVVKKLYGPEFYKAIGRKGGEATKAVHGPEFYQGMGKKGGQKVKQLLAEAMAARAAKASA